MKTFQQLIEKLEEDGMGGAPTNSASSGNIAGLGGDPVPVGSRKRKPCDSKFMGCPVYKVTSEEYQKCFYKKYLERKEVFHICHHNCTSINKRKEICCT